MNANSKDIGAYIKPVLSIAPVSTDGSADVNGSGVDRLGYYSGVVVCLAGAASGSPSAQSLVFQLEESSDNSAFTAVSGQTVTIEADDTLGKLNFDASGLKRYLRVVCTDASAFTGGSSPANDISALIVLGGADSLPAA
jgi:hypothetical protein